MTPTPDAVRRPHPEHIYGCSCASCIADRARPYRSIFRPLVCLCCTQPVPDAPITILCAWCADSPARTAQAERTGRRVTHGICPCCAATLEALATSD